MGVTRFAESSILTLLDGPPRFQRSRPRARWLNPDSTFQTRLTMGNADLKAYLCDENPPVCRLEARSHFLGLSPKEQSYAHFLSRASFHGSRICLRQASPHAEDIFDLLLAVFGDKVDLAALKAASGVSDTAFGQFLDYAAQFLSNLGEYKTFGDVKFVPRVSSEDFAKIVSASGSQRAIELFAKTRVAIYAEGAKESELHLGFPEDGHVSNFYDPKISKADIKDVQEALEANDVNPLNTRLFFDEAGNYKLLIASADVLPTKEITTANGKAIKLVYGDHQNEMKLAAEELRQAIPYAANETQAKMLQAYVDYFHSGDVKQFDASQIFWVQDKSPAVESNISFIETYRDPANIRAEWEGFVAVVNKERSKTFAEMVGKAPAFLKLLPWGPEFEKDVFQAPDFTALEVMSFATGGIPAGINIPNVGTIGLNFFPPAAIDNSFSSITFSPMQSGNPTVSKTSLSPTSYLPRRPTKKPHLSTPPTSPCLTNSAALPSKSKSDATNSSDTGREKC